MYASRLLSCASESNVITGIPASTARPMAGVIIDTSLTDIDIPSILPYVSLIIASMTSAWATGSSCFGPT